MIPSVTQNLVGGERQWGGFRCPQVSYSVSVKAQAGGSSEFTERPLLIRGESQELRYLQTPKPPLGGGGEKSNLLFRLMLLRHVGGGCSGQTGDTRGSKGPDSQGGRR